MVRRWLRDSSLAWAVLERVRECALRTALNPRNPRAVRDLAVSVALRCRRWEWSPTVIVDLDAE